jgi:hypothetical protein
MEGKEKPHKENYNEIMIADIRLHRLPCRN